MIALRTTRSSRTIGDRGLSRSSDAIGARMHTSVIEPSLTSGSTMSADALDAVPPSM